MLKEMWLQQRVRSGQPMIRYDPVVFNPGAGFQDPTGWSLVPMNAVALGDAGRLQPDGTFFLDAGFYYVLGALSGTARTVQSIVAPVGQLPLAVDVVDPRSAASLASVSGEALFIGFGLEVPDSGPGGSLVGVYQAWHPTGLSSTVSSGMPEVYASLLFLKRESCLAPALQFAAVQAFPSFVGPLTVPLLSWSPLFLNKVQTPDRQPTKEVFIVQPDSNGFRVPAGSYFVSGAVASNLNGAAGALVVKGASTNPLLERLLLQAFGGSNGNLQFLGIATVPDDGSGGSELQVCGFPRGRNQFGFRANTELANVYVGLTFLSIGTGDCDVLPFRDFFSVVQAWPSGQNAPKLVSSATAYAQLPLTTVVPPPALPTRGPFSTPRLLNGAFLVEAGTWYVVGATTGTAGMQPVGALLASLPDPEQARFEAENTLLQATNCFSGNMQFAGVVQLPTRTWVSLFVSYNAGQNYGYAVDSGLPEVYSQLSFLRVA